MRWFGWFRSKPDLEPLDLTPYRNCWVAVRDGKLLGWAPTVHTMMEYVSEQEGAWRGCTIWFEKAPEEPVLTGQW